jgi:hypothetical protein
MLEHVLMGLALGLLLLTLPSVVGWIKDRVLEMYRS